MFRNRTGGTRTGHYGRGERGFTLAEVLVAIAVFAIVSAIAMTLYARLQRSFKQGENASTQQQNTRIAFDRMISDLRMAGFNYNPDGDLSRPDEQIEGMWQNAITVRGDFDYETTDATTPENILGGPGMTFGVVSTGNDEIVTYALRKPNGSGGTTIQFQADVSNVPRDGTLETVSINNVWLDMNSPPYTLYRITVDPNTNTPNIQPVADDIKLLEFTYYDGTGAVISTFAGGMDTGTLPADREMIAKIGVRVIGMTQDPDLDYVDPTDPDPDSRNYRKFELSGDVVPRNLGFVGIPDLDLDDPSTPTGLSSCPGHCQGLWTSWNANPTADGVVKYQLTYGASVISQGAPQDVYSTSAYISGLTNGSSYVVGLRAVDTAGNRSINAAYTGPDTVVDTTRPEPPPGLSATGDPNNIPIANAINVSMNRSVHNDPTDPNSVLGCDLDPADPNKTRLRDLAGYRLFRGDNSGFDPTDPNQVQVQWDPNTLPPNATNPGVTDNAVVNCRIYWYKGLAEDLCGVQSTIVAGEGSSTFNAQPSAPLNVVATDMGLGRALLTWDPVTTDLNADSIVIDSYHVYNAVVATGSDPNLASYSYVGDVQVSTPATPNYVDPNAPVPPPGSDVYYRIEAHDDCLTAPTYNNGPPSSPALVTKCNFGGTLSMTMTPGGSPLSGTQTITVSVSGATTVGALLSVRDVVTGIQVYTASSATYPYTFTWDTAATAIPGGTYVVSVAVRNSSGCVDVVSQSVKVGGTFACAVQALNPQVGTARTGGPLNNEISFDIINTLGSPLDIDRLKIDWDDFATTICNKKGVSPELEAFNVNTADPNAAFTLVPPLPPTADFDFRNAPFAPPLQLAGFATTTVTYIFNNSMAFKCGSTDFANGIRSEFRTSSALLGGATCKINLVADTTSPSVSLCDPNVDPNCPLLP